MQYLTPNPTVTVALLDYWLFSLFSKGLSRVYIKRKGLNSSTTHRQLTEEQQIAAGAGPDVVRLSIGIEDAADIIADLDQALS